jgi:hypothetical protein
MFLQNNKKNRWLSDLMLRRAEPCRSINNCIKSYRNHQGESLLHNLIKRIKIIKNLNYKGLSPLLKTIYYFVSDIFFVIVIDGVDNL